MPCFRLQVTDKQSDIIPCGQGALQMFCIVTFWHCWKTGQTIDLIQLPCSWRDKNNSLKCQLSISKS